MKKKRWILPAKLLADKYRGGYRGFSHNEIYFRYIGRPPEKFIALYNKNAMNYSYWRIIKPCDDKLAWIVERGSCPRYWQNAIKPTKE